MQRCVLRELVGEHICATLTCPLVIHFRGRHSEPDFEVQSVLHFSEDVSQRRDARRTAPRAALVLAEDPDSNGESCDIYIGRTMRR